MAPLTSSSPCTTRRLGRASQGQGASSQTNDDKWTGRSKQRVICRQLVLYQGTASAVPAKPFRFVSPSGFSHEGSAFTANQLQVPRELKLLGMARFFGAF